MKKIVKKITKVLLLAILVAAVGLGGFYSWQSRQQLEYTDCLNDVAFTLNGEEVLMSQLGFYIVYEERVVEEQAKLYNPENTRDYWNLHVDGIFIQSNAKDTIMNMAVHDQLFYQLAKEENMQLDMEEEKAFQNAVTDFWMDLLDEQVEHMPVSDEYIVEAIRRATLAEKYQQQLAEQEGHSFASYNWDGYYYGQLLEEQDFEINDAVWDRITVGNISLRHGQANYINGYEKEEE
jgi:hypothetical protein